LFSRTTSVTTVIMPQILKAVGAVVHDRLRQWNGEIGRHALPGHRAEQHAILDVYAGEPARA
jgi:hypothetical protein